MSKRFDSYEDFVRDLDENSRLSADPFDVEVGTLDEEDLDLITYAPTRRGKRKPKE